MLSPFGFGLVPPPDGTETLDEDEAAMEGRTPVEGVVEVVALDTAVEFSIFVIDIVDAALDIEARATKLVGFKWPQFASSLTEQLSFSV
jgi:hypothetical protein